MTAWFKIGFSCFITFALIAPQVWLTVHLYGHELFADQKQAHCDHHGQPPHDHSKPGHHHSHDEHEQMVSMPCILAAVEAPPALTEDVFISAPSLPQSRQHFVSHGQALTPDSRGPPVLNC